MLRILTCLMLMAPMTALAGNKPNPVLTKENYQAKFDEIEDVYRKKPGMLKPPDVEKILGAGETVTKQHPDIANGPPVGADVQSWARWEFINETVLVGYHSGVAVTVVRHRR